MSEMWKRWEGQVIDHKYQLRQFLGSTDHSAVFAAEFRGPEPRRAAVKFLAADLPDSLHVLADWKAAQELSHPSLLPIYSVGRCQIEDMDLLYAATEYADENLSEILPHRALTADEAREMLTMVVDVLVFLHGKKLTHGHIKPSNIVAIGDQLKLSSDTIQPLAEAREMRRKRDVYDAPEIPSSPYTPAADVWSLGVTLVEALTQQPAFLPFNEKAEPVIAPSIREPFHEIAAMTLRRDPNLRWSSADVAGRLNPEAAESVKAALAAAAANVPTNTAAAMNAAPVENAASHAQAQGRAASPAVASPVIISAPVVPSATKDASPPPRPVTSPISPLSVPLSKEPAAPLGKQPGAKPAVERPPLPPTPVPRPAEKSGSPDSKLLPNYVVPVLAAVLILMAIIALPKILHRVTEPSASSASPAPSSTMATSSPGPDVAPTAKKPAAVPKAPPSKSDSMTSAPQPPNRPPSAPSTSPAILHNGGPAPIASTRKANGSPDRGEVLDQILPRPNSAALGTIQGTLRVVVRVHVDEAGNVSQATLENPGPSKYFAEKSLEAARGWVFLSPATNGHSEASEWQIRFEFTPKGANAYPKQLKP